MARTDPVSTREMAQAELMGSWEPQRVQNTVSRPHSSLRSGRRTTGVFVRPITPESTPLADIIATVSEDSDIM